MLSNRITNSAAFLQMPLETQALYFHLCVNADDDGVVEAYSILKTLGTGDDSMRILVAKDFVYPLNQESVLYVVNWREHNSIRPDRLVKSIHRKLLKDALPGIQLVDPAPRADTKVLPRQNDWTSSGRHKLSQVKLREDNNTGLKAFSEGKPIGELIQERRGGLNI